MLRGVRKLANAVTVTLGPRGRNVCLEKAFGPPVVTKDGVSVAKEIELLDHWENLGARLVREVASKTSDDAGDGTTTSVVLASWLIERGLALVAGGHAPVALKRGMDKSLELLVDQLIGLSIPVRTQEHVEHVASISANGDRSIGKIIADAVARVGKDGVVNIEEGKTMETVVETTDVLKFDRGWHSSEFCMDNDRQESVLVDTHVLVTDYSIATARPLLPVLEKLVQGGHSLVIIAPDFTGDAIPTFAQNLKRGSLKAQIVKAPGFGFQQAEFLKDLAVVTGATFITKDLGMTLNDLTMEHLGKAERIRVTSKDTVLTGGSGSPDEIERRVAAIKGEIDRSGSEYDKDKLRERMSRLLGGICVIKVGAPTELAMKELKARMEDALYATQASIDEGVLPGGGTALLRAADRVRELMAANDSGTLTDDNGGGGSALSSYALPEGPDERVGFDLVLRVCEEPLAHIAHNAGKNGDLLVERVRAMGSQDEFIGFDAADMTLKNMLEAGILDPLKVVRSAIQNAVSVAGTMLTTEAGIRKDRPLKPSEVQA
jgi:chaperonin GroEL